MADPTFTEPADPRQVLSIREAAAILGISRPTAYKAVKAGQLPVIRIGNQMKVPKAALDALLKAA